MNEEQTAPKTDLNLNFSSQDLKNQSKNPQKSAKSNQKSAKFAIFAFVVGLLLFVSAIIFFILRQIETTKLSDADFLIENSPWILSNSSQPCDSQGGREKSDLSSEQNTLVPACELSRVAWAFTEIGKGSLTTNDHENDYDFLWSIDGETLTLETSWLYTLDNSYAYHLDQNAKTLTLTGSSGEEYVFSAADEN